MSLGANLLGFGLRLYPWVTDEPSSQIHYDGWRDAINRRLYRKYIRQLFFDKILAPIAIAQNS